VKNLIATLSKWVKPHSKDNRFVKKKGAIRFKKGLEIIISSNAAHPGGNYFIDTL